MTKYMSLLIDKWIKSPFDVVKIGLLLNDDWLHQTNECSFIFHSDKFILTCYTNTRLELPTCQSKIAKVGEMTNL